MSRDETPDTTGLPCACPHIDGFRIRRSGCPKHAEKDAPHFAAHPTPDAHAGPAVVTPDAGDVETLAEFIAPMCNNSKEYQDWPNLRKKMGRRLAERILASDWLANHVAAAREADRAEVERLRSDLDVTSARLAQVLRDLLSSDTAEERLAGLVAQIEALIKPRLVRDSVSGLLSEVRKVHVRVRDLRPLIEAADAATALDAVREKAKAEERERIAQAIGASRSHFCRVTNTHPAHPTAQAYDDAARIARHTPGATS